MVCPPSRWSCLPLSLTVPLLVALGWMVRLPSRESCLPLSLIVPLLVALCWMVCPPCHGCCFSFSPLLDGAFSRGSCLPLSPIVPFFLFVGWCVRFPEGLVSLCLPLYPSTLSCFPLLDGAFAFLRSCLPLSPIVRLLASLRWMVCPPSRGSSYLCLPLYPFLLPKACVVGGS